MGLGAFASLREIPSFPRAAKVIPCESWGLMSVLPLSKPLSWMRRRQPPSGQWPQPPLTWTALLPTPPRCRPGRLWAALAAAARQATRPVAGVEGIGLACLAPALVLLDAKDRPLRPVWTNLDRRSRPAARQVWLAAGKEFLADTGNRPLPGGISAVCFRQQVSDSPYLLHDVTGYLHANSWLVLHMTGERACDRANACLTGLYGTMTDQKWSERWCSYFEVEPSWLPPVVCGSTTVGTLRSALAAELGVPAGLPVKLGTADIGTAMLAAGMGAGDLLHIVGNAHTLAVLTGMARADPRRLTCQLGVGQAFIHVSYNPVGGSALDWLRNLCFRDQSTEQFYQQTLPLARKHSTRVTLDPPHLGSDQLEIEGHRAAFRDLTLAVERLDLLAAVLEALQRKQRACPGRPRHRWPFPACLHDRQRGRVRSRSDNRVRR